VIVRRRLGAVPYRVSLAAGLVPLGLGFGLAFGPLGFHAGAVGGFLFGRELAADVCPPVLPIEAILEVLEATGRHAVEVQQIGPIQLAGGAVPQLAAVQLAVSVEAIGQAQAAGFGGGAEFEDEAVSIIITHPIPGQAMGLESPDSERNTSGRPSSAP
jgi:hypothetical protein